MGRRENDCQGHREIRVELALFIGPFRQSIRLLRASEVEDWLRQDECGDDYINEEYGWMEWMEMNQYGGDRRFRVYIWLNLRFTVESYELSNLPHRPEEAVSFSVSVPIVQVV